ncbi:hypothetical protein KY284_030046 [Solanum tuberosum]|nr:hypothetical protein KY284_030046 [Solanum tuberosum]
MELIERTQPLPSKTLKNPPNDPDGTELFGETVNLGWKSSSPFEVFMDEEPGGNSDDPVVLENLKEKFRHSTIGELTVTNNIVSEIKQTNRGFNMLFTARRAPMDFALVEDKSAYRRHQRFIWSTLDSLVRSRAIDDSIRTDVFLAVECRADVEGTLGGYPEVLLRYGFKLSWGSIDARKSFLEEIDTTMYTPQMCNLIWNEFGLYDKAIHFRNALLKKKFYKHVKYSRLNIPTNHNEALGGNENENEEDNEGNENEEDNETESESGNENEEDNETESESGNENEEDNETESESGNENEEAGPEADPAGLETDQEADSDDV